MEFAMNQLRQENQQCRVYPDIQIHLLNLVRPRLKEFLENLESVIETLLVCWLLRTAMRSHVAYLMNVSTV